MALMVASGAFAQGEWNWRMITPNDSGALLQASFEYQMGSTALNNALLNDAVFGSELTAERALENTDRFSGDRGRVGGFAEGELWFRSGGSKWHWMAGVGFRELFGANISTDLMRLYLRGNGPYEDETLDLSDSKVFNMSHQFIGLGAEMTGEKLTWGFSANLLKIGRYQEVDLQSADLYTAPFGEYIESNMALSYETAGSSEPKLSAWYGTGITLSTYMDAQISQRSSIHVKVKDLGVMMFQGLNTYSVDTTYLYDGVEINNILQLDDSIFANGDLDSLEAILGLRSTNETRSVLSPGYAEIGFRSELSPNMGLRIVVRQWWRAGASTQFEIGVPFVLSPTFTLEPNLRFGSWANTVAGLAINWQPGDRFALWLQASQFQNLVASTSSSGQSLATGVSLRF